MLKVILTVGIPASGKSTWAKEQVSKDPEGTVRINRDDLRIMLNNYQYSTSNEKLVIQLKNFAILSALKHNRNVIIDETNLVRSNFTDICDMARSLNKDIMVLEKTFYIDLQEAIDRDSQRIGPAHVGKQVISKFWKKSGGKLFQHYNCRVEIISPKNANIINKPIVNVSLPNAIICDLDGTLALFNTLNKDGSVSIKHHNAHTRSPYNASDCEHDLLNEAVAKVVTTLYKENYKVIFCSGREDIYRTQTENFINNHLKIDYELFMRKSGDQRKDSIIKEEIYKNNIEGKYNVLLVLDDRNAVVEYWRSIGLPCFQVAEGNF